MSLLRFKPQPCRKYQKIKPNKSDLKATKTLMLSLAHAVKPAPLDSAAAEPWEPV